jgi:uncharacterized protein (TIGR00266 family)
MRDQILGTTLPVLTVNLEANEAVTAEIGEFSWMSDSVQMQTGMGGGMGGSGFMGAVKRKLSGSSILFTTYTAVGAPGFVAFASKVPGSIVPVDVAPGNEVMVHRHGFLCGIPGVQITIGFQQSFAAGIFAGEGFILQKITGQGRAWVELSGELVTYDLAPGQSLRVHPGHVGMFQTSVNFQVMRVPGVANRYFGGDAHHFAVLTGPGRIWLQSMPITMLAATLAPYMQSGGDHRGVEAGVAGGLLGGLLGG